MTRRHWYHCSAVDLGAAFVARRRPPVLRTPGEPLTPRLCVCDTVAACFAAVLFPDRRPVFVYRTQTPRRAVRPVGVWDQVITGERWLIPPVRMVRVAVIPRTAVANATAAIRLYHEATRKCSTAQLRVAQYAVATAALGPEYTSPRERRLVNRFCRKLGVGGDPEDFILTQAVRN